MKILSIETSCDDTGISILEMHGTFSARGGSTLGGKILADSLAVQSIHAQYGGVYPMMAKREHIKNLPILLEQVLKKAKLDTKKKPVDLIAVTYGPGLEPCLWTGITFAQELAQKWGVPVIPTNHMEGHILSVFGKNTGKFTMPKTAFPALSLLVSGGHTELVLIKDWGKYKILGHTVDDAAGEAYDKVARMLGLPYPGGPHISKLAELERIRRLKSTDIFLGKNSSYSSRRSPQSFQSPNSFTPFPRPMLHSKNFNFSFSGLKTAVLYYIQKNKNFDKAEVALEFENAVVETLVHKTKKAVEKYKVKTLIVAGGVAVNTHLKREMKKTFAKKVKLLFPTPYLCRDNSLMIGIAGYLQFMKKKGRVGKPDKIKAVGNLSL